MSFIQGLSRGYALAAAAETVKVGLYGFLLCSSFFIAFLIQAPIKIFGIEGRYAHALFSAAAKQKSLDKVEKELNDFQVCRHVCLCFFVYVYVPRRAREQCTDVHMPVCVKCHSFLCSSRLLFFVEADKVKTL